MQIFLKIVPALIGQRVLGVSLHVAYHQPIIKKPPGFLREESSVPLPLLQVSGLPVITGFPFPSPHGVVGVGFGVAAPTRFHDAFNGPVKGFGTKHDAAHANAEAALHDECAELFPVVAPVDRADGTNGTHASTLCDLGAKPREQSSLLFDEERVELPNGTVQQTLTSDGRVAFDAVFGLRRDLADVHGCLSSQRKQKAHDVPFRSLRQTAAMCSILVHLFYYGTLIGH